MQSKTLVLIGLFVGSTIGSCIPLLWGGSIFSFSSIVFSTLGGFVGIYIFFKMSQ